MKVTFIVVDSEKVKMYRFDLKDTFLCYHESSLCRSNDVLV